MLTDYHFDVGYQDKDTGRKSFTKDWIIAESTLSKAKENIENQCQRNNWMITDFVLLFSSNINGVNIYNKRLI